MFHLCNVLQLVIYRLYDGTFPEQQFVRHAYQSTFHVVFKFGDKLYAVHEQALEKVLADIAFVCDQLPVYEFNEGLVFQRFPVIHISRGYHEVEQLPFSLQIRCSLKPKNHPMENLPLCAMPLNTLWICILWFLHTLRGVLSTQLMPVHFPSNTFLMNRAKGMATSFSSSTKRLYETTFGKR